MRVAVIQVKTGIGDLMWHLPFIRAIAAASPGKRVSFFVPPSTGAKELLAAEISIAEIHYFEHAGSELRRGINQLRLIGLLRRGAFGRIWILDRTSRPALAALLAGIPERVGLGFSRQRLLITNPPLDQKYFHDHPIDGLVHLMEAMRVPLPTTEPNLTLPPALLAMVAERYAGVPRPWSVLGIGGTRPDKDWPDEYWSEFLQDLRARSGGTMFLIGGPDQAARARRLIERVGQASIVDACDLSLVQSAALLAQADVFAGVDSGPLNISAAVGTKAFGMFGNTPVLTYSKHIEAVLPEGGQSPVAMTRIAPSGLARRVADYLAQAKPKDDDNGYTSSAKRGPLTPSSQRGEGRDEGDTA